MSENDETEKALIGRAAGGDSEARAELVRLHQDFIYNAVCHMIDDRNSADDLTQSVFLKALENIGSFEMRAKFSTWLYSIMINTVRNYQRKEHTRRSFSLDENPGDNDRDPIKADLSAAGKEPWEALVSKENTEIVRCAIASLESDHREIIVLRDIEGLSYKRLAKILDISPGTVKSRLSRARNALKQKLEQMTERI